MKTVKVSPAISSVIRMAIIVFFVSLAVIVVSAIFATVTVLYTVLPLLLYALITFITAAFQFVSLAIIGACVLGFVWCVNRLFLPPCGAVC